MTIMLTRDRVCETTSTTGTGNLLMLGAVTGFRSFSTAGYATLDTFPYTIFAVDSYGNPTGDWETGYGSYETTNATLVRALPIAGSATVPVSFAAGTKRVFIGPLAAHSDKITSPNKLLNPEMLIDQQFEGNSTALAAMSGVTNYVVDQWAAWLAATTNTASTAQRLATSPPVGFKNSIRVQKNSGQTGTQRINLGQVLESYDCYDLQSEYATLSFWAKRGADFGGSITAEIITGTGTDQTLASMAAGTWTGQAAPGGLQITLTTSWQRYSLTTTAVCGSTVSQAGVRFYYDPSGTAGANDWFEITGVKLEKGIIPTAFEHEPRLQQLHRCQRYYWKTFADGTAPAQNAGATSCLAYVVQTTGAVYAGPVITYPVTMRAAPTLTAFNPSAANAKWRNWSLTADSGNFAAAPGSAGTMFCVALANPQVAGDTASNTLQIHLTANARL